MPRKEVITKNELLRCAFELARQEGCGEVTARKLANKAGCSTQPIFRAYKNMEELLDEMMNHAVAFFERFYDDFPKQDENIPFLNLGITYISFAKEEKNLFQMMFLKEKNSDRSLYELINGRNGNVLKEIYKAREDGCKNAEDLFMKMWIFIHGAACMTITGDYDLTETETIELIQNAYNAFKK